MKTLYQYTIKCDEEKTVLTEKGSRMPIAAVYENADEKPIHAAGLLRDLARWAIEQAEIIENIETGKPIPERVFCGEYVATLVEAAHA